MADVQCLITAREFFFQDGTGRLKYGRGDILIVRDEISEGVLSIPWGGSETVPDYVRLRVTGTTREQVENWLGNWKNSLDYSILNSNANGWRIKLTVDPALISATNINAELRTEVLEAVELDYGFDVQSSSATEIVCDVPKNPDGTIPTAEAGTFADLAALKADFNDKFEDITQPRLYYFRSAAVDSMVATITGGAEYAEGTKAEALAQINSRLDD